MPKKDKDISAIMLRRNVAISSAFSLIAIGTIVFRYLEHWTWINSFYFVVATSATVGYGDITPHSAIGRLLASIYILIIVPIVLYSFTTIAEISFEKRVQRRVKIDQEKISNNFK